MPRSMNCPTISSSRLRPADVSVKRLTQAESNLMTSGLSLSTRAMSESSAPKSSTAILNMLPRSSVDQPGDCRLVTTMFGDLADDAAGTQPGMLRDLEHVGDFRLDAGAVAKQAGIEVDEQSGMLAIEPAHVADMQFAAKGVDGKGVGGFDHGEEMRG